MAEVINELGEIVYSHLRKMRLAKASRLDDPLDDFAAQIEIILTPEQMAGIKLDCDAISVMRLYCDAPPTFIGIPVYEIPDYDGPFIRPRGYAYARNS